MAEGTFDRLVTSLRKNEREDLLERLSQYSDLSTEPLYEKVEERPESIEDEFTSLPILLRVWYSIVGFFFGKTPVRAYENRLIAKTGREINTDFPGMYSYTQALLLPGMHKAFVELKEAARFFYTALDDSVNRDKGAFYAFMSSFDMPDIHYALSTISNPEEFAKTAPDAPPEKLRQIAVETGAESLNSIVDTQRDKMYRNVRALICLRELSGFLFDRLITSFQFDPSLAGNVCPAGLVKGQLAKLNNILFSMKEVPPPALLNSLFVFSMNDGFDIKDDKISAKAQKLMSHAEKSLAVIRNFNRNIPLTLIIRCVNRNMAYEPLELPGGEDWFAIFRNYWKNKIDEYYHGYVLRKKQDEINKTLESFFNGPELVMDENEQQDGIQMDNAFLFSFLRAFYKRIFIADMNHVLRSVLIDGDFTRVENQRDFTESYNELIKMDDMITRLVQKAALDGEYGKRYQQLKVDVVSPVIRYRKIQTLLDDVLTESKSIAERSKNALDVINKVVYGILSGTDSQYASLTNLSTMWGKANRDFIINLKNASDKLSTAAGLVDNILSIRSD